MVPGLLITFRETLEAALIVGIVLSYLSRTRQQRFNPAVYLGIVSGIGASLLGAFLFNTIAGGFEGRSEQLFEGLTMLAGAGLLTTMILWMLRRKNVKQELESQIATSLNQSQRVGLFLVVFLAVLREGIETVLFLSAASFVTADHHLLGALIGIVSAIILGYLVFVSSLRINLKTFFNYTSVLLILLAAGLIAHAVHEFQEAGLLPFLTGEVWNLNPALSPDGSYPLFHENGVIGSLLKGLFGYNGNPSLLEILTYGLYLVLVALLWRHAARIKPPAATS